MKSMSVSRRTLLTGTVALGTVGLLAACGGSKEKVGGSAANNAEDILKNLRSTSRTVPPSSRAVP